MNVVPWSEFHLFLHINGVRTFSVGEVDTGYMDTIQFRYWKQNVDISDYLKKNFLLL